MVIGIDIDDTITKTTEGITKLLSINEIMTLNHEEIEKLVIKNTERIIPTLELKEQVLEVLNYFKDLGIKLVFITARGDNAFEKMISLTNLYFEQKKIPYDEIVYAKTYKGKTAQDLGVNVFIDDKEEVLDDVAKYGIKTVRMVNNDDSSKHFVVKSWQEFKDYIDSIGGENYE